MRKLSLLIACTCLFWSAVTAFARSSSLSARAKSSVANDGAKNNRLVTKLVTAPPTNNANLLALTTSAGSLSPGFVSTKTSYTVTVANLTTSATVKPTASDVTATITVNGTFVTSGSNSGSISLAVGPNLITTVVTSSDGSTIHTYNIYINRASPLQTVVSGSAAAVVSFANNAGITYNWTNSNPAIGLAASGTGNIASFTTVNPGSSAITATITATPVYLVYIANNASNTVSVVNSATNAVRATIPVGSAPFGVSVSPDGSMVYVTNQNSNTVSVISTAGDTVKTTVTVGTTPTGISFNADGSFVYVANFGSNTVSVISTATNTVTATIPVGANPMGVAVSPNGNNVYVANENSNNVSVISTATNTVTATIAVGTNPYGLAVIPDGSKVYVANYTSNNVSVITTATNTVTATVAVGTHPTGVAARPGGAEVFVANNFNNVNDILTATNTVALIIPVAGNLIGISFSPDNSKAYVTKNNLNSVAVINAPSHGVSTTFADGGNGPASLGNFVTGTGSQSLSFVITVNPNPDTIAFNPLPQVVYGSSDFSPGATTNNSNPSTPITYSSDNTAVATIVGGNIHIVSAGTANITASQVGDTYHYAAADVIQQLTVSPAPLTITADNQSKAYGSVNPTLTASYSGFVNGDTQASLTTLPTVGTTAVTGSAAGAYPITANGAVSPNYTISYVAGTLTVNPVALTITADNQSKVYGSANPTLSVTYTGFVNGDTNATLTTQPTITTTATVSSPVGSYPITASSAVNSNYTIGYVAGTLTVNKAALTIAANNASKVYGSVNPALSVTYTGFVNGDTNASLTTQPTISTTAVTGSAVGTYPITASAAASANYSISYTAGTLTVTRAALTIAANNATKVYGAVNPALGVTYSGFVNGDTNASLTTQPTISTTAVTGSAVGAYPITANGAASANYSISYTAGTLTVTQAALTIAANNATKVYGAVNPALVVTYTGFVNGDTNASLTTQPTISTTAVTGSAVGTYPITASSAASANYSISYTAGTLTVTQAALTITASNATKVYGAVNPTLGVTYTGFVNGDTNINLTTQPTVTTTAVTGSPVGTYPITASGAVSANYSMSYTAGTLTITPAALTITASNQTRVFNTANPTLTATYTGFVNGDTNASLTTQPTLSTTAVLVSPIGSYPITVSGAASANYTISYVAGTLTVTPSLNASLANLVISSGTLSPTFVQATTAYTASVVNAITQVTLTPTTADPTSTVKVNGVSVTSGSASANIPLTVGTNIITTVVTAQDGTTTKTYTIIVTRAASGIASLASLSTSSGSISPTFSSSTPGYTLSVNNTISALTVTAMPTDPTATITVNGAPVSNGLPSGGIPLNTGNNMITIVVTAQDGITKQTYTLAVQRGIAPEAVTANNILTPNGDGKNDYWIVKDIQFYPNNNVWVYDRAGREVFAKHGYNNDWDGTLKGAPLLQGTYYYIVNLENGLPQLKGFISILRSK